MSERKLDIPTEQEILEGMVTDQYFEWTEKVLEGEGRNPEVAAEISVSDPGMYILAGVKDAANLLQGIDLDFYCAEEGTMFQEKIPVARVEGRFLDFCRFESPLLGMLCHASGVATAAAKIKEAAQDTPVLSFGTRRMHPANAAMIERSAYIGGCDGVSNVAGAEIAGLEPKGTMPHALVIAMGNQEEAWEAYNKHVPDEVPRTALCDTFSDEVDEVVRAVETLGGDLDAVRLDTTSSRRGDMAEIVEEVKWEIERIGREDIDVYVSGGIDREDVEKLREQVDGFGVGGAIANADPVDFSMNIVEVDGEPVGKRGVKSGKKLVNRVVEDESVMDIATLMDSGEEGTGLLHPVVEDGEIVQQFDAEEARKNVSKYWE